MSIVFLDLETLPNMAKGEVERIAEETEFKAPRELSKGQAAADLGFSDGEVKYKSKDDVLAMWVDKFKDSKKLEVAEEVWRKQALNPDEGRICSIVFSTDGQEYHSFMCEDEKELLECFWITIMNKVKTSELYLVGHNITFDISFLWKRSVINNLTHVPFKLKPHGYHGRDFFCTMQAWAGRNKFISQDQLCKILGIEGKPEGIDGSKVLDAYIAGEYDKILAYNQDDVEKVHQIYNRLNV